ncbi:unnamed protein product (macronuclear) [Paramecium tetraurelia]|uniref:Uncharacterized protein n=1 Tax=Paramecium tetraurelia TaxID=5888 RepID=A0CJJ6_PARTE|nr:uncharacterized protein GSPATT00000675001 [Paramecium tetraurelia]CAK70963.1 unnamed protein product [Paramecium tetraurelia]|eukprot:XP_001438360.1 hypothetical protein (macronuclear) [Paramecium tetraurelia strain d4-2]
MQPPSSEEDILNFMAVTGCQDYQKAQSYIQMAENKLDNAIQLYMDFEGGQGQSAQQKTQQDQQQQRSTIQETPKGNVQRSNQGNSRQPQDVALIEKYRKYQEEKRAKDEGIMKKTLQMGANLFSYFFNNPPNYGNEFLQYLKQHQIQTEIAFQSGNFKDKMQKANEETRPLLVYLHNHQSLLILQKMSSCKPLTTILNRNYNIVGFLNSPQAYEQMPNKPDPPAILIYKLDIVDEVVLMEQFSLSIDTNFEEVAQKIKTLRAAFNKEYIYIENIKKEVNSPNQPNLNHSQYYQQSFHQVQQQQQSQVQRQKEDQRERDLLIQQQKEAYRFAEQQAIEKKRKDEELRLQEQAKQLEQQQKEEQRLLKKAQLLSNLPEEPQNSEGISILFRFINATRTRRFHFNDKIQVLFDFVESQEDDCFNDPHSKIDLIQNYPRLSLKDKTESIISEVFVDSEMEQLIVDEQE